MHKWQFNAHTDGFWLTIFDVLGNWFHLSSKSRFFLCLFLLLLLFLLFVVFVCLLLIQCFFFFSLHLNNCKYIILWRPMGNDAGWWIMMHYFIRFNCNIIYIDSILGLVNELTDLFDCQDNEELSRAAASVKDILLDGQPHSLKNHRPITSLSPKHY